MRVPTQSISNTVLNNLQMLRERMLRAQTQLATGLSFQLASEAPGRTLDTMLVKTGLQELTQFEDNMADGAAWLQSAEGALVALSTHVTRARDLAVNGAHGALSQDAYNALAAEVESIREEALAILNESHAGRYLFGGHVVDRKPFAEGAGGDFDYLGNAGELRREIAPGVLVAVNLPGSRLAADGAAGLGRTLFQLAADLRAGDHNAVGTARLNELDDGLTTLVALRSEVGARLKRLEQAQSRAMDTRINLATILSAASSTEYEPTILELNMAETAYATALAIGARLIPPSLMDFIR